MGKYVRTKPNEEWKEIDWLFDKDGNQIKDYIVSNFGRVKKKNRLLKVSINRDGYFICYINTKPMLVHRLVAQAFIPHPEELNVVDHIDENKTNNNADNLRWTTRRENTNYAHINRKKRGQKKPHFVMDVLAIDKDHNAALYSSLVEAAKGTGLNEKIVGQIARGNVKSSHGWKFIKIKTFRDWRK